MDGTTDPRLTEPQVFTTGHGAMSVRWPALRTLWHLDPKILDGDGEYTGDTDGRKQVDTMEEANLVSSLLTNGRHAPVLDLDHRVRLVPSSTEGHFHLYFDDIELEWKDYVRLLRLLAELDILEPGFVDASIDRGQTMVRKPGVHKGDSQGPRRCRYSGFCQLDEGHDGECRPRPPAPEPDPFDVPLTHDWLEPPRPPRRTLRDRFVDWLVRS